MRTVGLPMQRERHEIEAALPRMIDSEVNAKVSALKQKFQAKICRMQRKLTDRSLYEQKVKEVMEAGERPRPAPVFHRLTDCKSRGSPYTVSSA